MEGFKKEAEQIIRLLPDRFSSHHFYKLYAMGFPLSYLEWMKNYSDVQTAHIQISNSLLRLSKTEIAPLPIKRDGDGPDPNIFGNSDVIAWWKKTK